MVLINILCLSGILMSYLAIYLQVKDALFPSDECEIFKK
jgi:hypothetical protein